MSGILIIGEILDDKVSRTTFELLGGARKVALQQKSQVSIVVFGNHLGDYADTLMAYGAERVYLAEHPLLGEYQADIYLVAAEQICKELVPDVILFSSSCTGRELAPRLAYRLNTGVVTDCTAVIIDEDTQLLLFRKPVYGGKALALMTMSTPQIATVRPRSLDPMLKDDSSHGEVIKVKLNLNPDMKRTRVIEFLHEDTVGVKLEDANIIVSGGRGIGGPENFAILHELAAVLKGAVGASRAAVDSGWVPPSRQVGQTGKVVAPNLYIAVGISGASQHLAGISAAKHIVAINTDSDAPIFKAAEVGVVEDYKKVIPALIRKLKEVL